jgi:hypothetical protein
MQNNNTGIAAQMSLQPNRFYNDYFDNADVSVADSQQQIRDAPLYLLTSLQQAKHADVGLIQRTESFLCPSTMTVVNRKSAG